jgi:hypothetical protein
MSSRSYPFNLIVPDGEKPEVIPEGWLWSTKKRTFYRKPNPPRPNFPRMLPPPDVQVCWSAARAAIRAARHLSAPDRNKLRNLVLEELKQLVSGGDAA